MKKFYVKRLLKLPDRSFFLFGPRGVGKTTWLREVLADASFFDLLDSSLYLEFSQSPGNLEAMVRNLPKGSWIVEVHRLMETRGWRFALYFYRTGSGVEIDFVIETRKRRSTSNAHIVCLEIKLAKKWDRKWERPMRSLSKSGRIHVDKMIGVYTGKRAYYYDGIDILPVEDFLELLHQGDVF